MTIVRVTIFFADNIARLRGAPPQSFLIRDVLGFFPTTLYTPVRFYYCSRAHNTRTAFGMIKNTLCSLNFLAGRIRALIRDGYFCLENVLCSVFIVVNVRRAGCPRPLACLARRGVTVVLRFVLLP